MSPLLLAAALWVHSRVADPDSSTREEPSRASCGLCGALTTLSDVESLQKNGKATVQSHRFCENIGSSNHADS